MILNSSNIRSWNSIFEPTSRIYKTPSFSRSSRAIISRSSASISSTSPSSSAKLSDRMVKLFAIDPDGQKQEIIGLSGQTLLKALPNHGLIDPESHRSRRLRRAQLSLRSTSLRNGWRSFHRLLVMNCMCRREILGMGF